MTNKLLLFLFAVTAAIGIIRLKNYWVEPNYEKISIRDIGSDRLTGLKYIEIRDAWSDGSYVEATDVNLKNLSASKKSYLFHLLEKTGESSGKDNNDCQSKLVVLGDDKNVIKEGPFHLKGQILLRKLSANERTYLERRCKLADDHILVLSGWEKPSLLISLLMIFVAFLGFFRTVNKINEQRSR